MHHGFMNKLVEQASNRFSLQSKLAHAEIKSVWSPDITISRDPGSGGKVIAQKIAKKLGWKLLDKEIMVKLSEELGIPEESFAKIDENTRNWFADSFNALFNPSYVSDIRYLNYLKKLLIHSAKDGNVVIVGRGANHIIPPEKSLRVRVTASYKTRVDNTIKHEKRTRADAESWVTHVQNKRNNFIKQYFGQNAYDPANFDLIVNTDQLDLIQARNLIINAYFAKFPAEHKRLKSKI